MQQWKANKQGEFAIKENVLIQKQTRVYGFPVRLEKKWLKEKTLKSPFI